MNNLQKLTKLINQIDKQTRDSLKTVNNVKNLFTIADNLKNVLDTEEIKTIVKELKGERATAGAGSELSKSLDKFGKYVAFIYEVDQVKKLIAEFEEVKKYNSDKAQEIKRGINQKYIYFLRTLEHCKGFGVVTAAFKSLKSNWFNWFTEPSKLINPKQQSEDLTKLISLDDETDKLKEEETKELQDLKNKYKDKTKKIKRKYNKQRTTKEKQKSKIRNRLGIEQPKEDKPKQEDKQSKEVKAIQPINEVKQTQEVKPTEELRDYRNEFKGLIKEVIKEVIKELNPFNKVRKLISSLSYGLHHSKKYLRDDHSEGITIRVNKEETNPKKKNKNLRKYLRACNCLGIEPSTEVINKILSGEITYRKA